MMIVIPSFDYTMPAAELLAFIPSIPPYSFYFVMKQVLGGIRITLAGNRRNSGLFLGCLDPSAAGTAAGLGSNNLHPLYWTLPLHNPLHQGFWENC
jgi:hypothetical protein